MSVPMAQKWAIWDNNMMPVRLGIRDLPHLCQNMSKVRRT